MTKRFFCAKTSYFFLQFISTRVCITLLKDVCVEVLPWYSYSKKVLFYSILIQFYLKVILRKLCSLLQFFVMLSCDNAVWKAEISRNFWWLKPFKVNYKWIFDGFLYMRFKCTHNAHLSRNLVLFSSFS